jgi:hypothetical protein
MFDRFRKAEDPEKKKLKKLLDEHRLTVAAKNKAMLEVCFNIGRTLLTCAMVEDNVNSVLDIMTPVGIARGSWLADGKHPQLRRAIEEMRKRYEIDQDFYDDLERFRECRNRFVHGIWKISKHPFSSVEGRREVAEFITDLQAQAASLHAIFYPLLTRFQGGQLGWTVEQVESWIPETMRTPSSDG